MSNRPAYHVEIEAGGCKHCGRGQTYCVVAPDGASLGSFDHKEDAQGHADELNEAYRWGRERA